MTISYRTHTGAPAQDVARRCGYDATSVQNLVRCMGINRGSLYATFGDTCSLFIGLRVLSRSRPEEALLRSVVSQAEALIG
jgi:TetR/AcrR family transcriptional repressor of nem operon